MNEHLKECRLIGPTHDTSAYFSAVQEHERGDANRVMTRSDLVEFTRCPQRWHNGYRDDVTDEMDWGSLIDCMVLTPDQFDERYVVCPPTYPPDNKPWTRRATYCKEWEDRQAGKTVLKPEQELKAREAVHVLHSDPDAAALISCSQTQVWVVGTFVCEYGEVPIQCLIDLVPDKADDQFGKTLADLKTTTNAEEHTWRKAVFTRGYDIQAALSMDLYTEATGEDRTDWRHLIQENFPPYQLGFRLLSNGGSDPSLTDLPAYVNLGRMRYISGLTTYAKCLKEDYWHGYEVGPRIGRWSLCEPEPWMVIAER